MTCQSPALHLGFLLLWAATTPGQTFTGLCGVPSVLCCSDGRCKRGGFPDAPCYCDNRCVENGDCCPDYEEICPGVRCGAPSRLCCTGPSDLCIRGPPGAHCLCQENCILYHNCCPDYTKVCQGGSLGTHSGSHRGVSFSAVVWSPLLVMLSLCLL